MAPSTEPVVLVASATDIIKTTYIQAITTRYTDTLSLRDLIAPPCQLDGSQVFNTRENTETLP